jgi:hypothetical protein
MQDLKKKKNVQIVCVCVCRRNGRVQHELRPPAARAQHPCGNAGSCLHFVGPGFGTR